MIFFFNLIYFKFSNIISSPYGTIYGRFVNKTLFTTMLLASLNSTSTRLGPCIVNIRNIKNIVVHVICTFQELGSQWQDTIFNIRHLPYALDEEQNFLFLSVLMCVFFLYNLSKSKLLLTRGNADIVCYNCTPCQHLMFTKCR